MTECELITIECTAQMLPADVSGTYSPSSASNVQPTTQDVYEKRQQGDAGQGAYQSTNAVDPMQ